jgi:hypothetical protein
LLSKRNLYRYAAGVLGGYINSPYDIPTRTVASCVTILGILYFSIVLGLVVEAGFHSLPGVRLLTWTTVAVIN